MNRLGEIAEVCVGQAAPQEPGSFGTSGFPFIRAGSLERLCAGAPLRGLEQISSDVAKKYRLRLFPANTILFAKSGMSATLGRIYKMAGPAYVVSHLAAIIPKYDIDSGYLVHFFVKNPPSSLIANEAYPSIRLSEIEDLNIPLPSIEEQRRIAAILDKAESISIKRQKTIQLAGDLVKSQFIEMFGTWDELDKWPCKIIDDIADVTVGVVIKPAQYYTELPDGIRAFRSLNVGEMYVRDGDWVYFTSEGNKVNKKSELKEGDVLVVRSGYPGTSCVVTSDYAGSNAIDIIIARPDTTVINSIYLCAFTNFSHGKNQIKKKIGGAAQQHLNIGAYRDVTIALPPLSLQNQFAAFVKQADKSKFSMKKSLDDIEMMYKSLAQEYFG